MPKERPIKPDETREQTQARADYHSWKRTIKTPPRPNDNRTMEQLWKSALAILNGEEQEWKQMVPRDLDDGEFYGREHIMALLTMRMMFEDYVAFIRIVQPFLLVITHSAFLDCLSVDTFVGGLYNFISGTNGTRAVPFFQHICETLVGAHVDAVTSGAEITADQTLFATSTALRELLRRESRARFNDDLPILIDSMENAVQVVTGDCLSVTATIILGHGGEMRAMMARAKGLLVQGDQQKAPSTSISTSAYPRTLIVPRNRHDNDKTDITKLKIFPTREEILSDEAEFLPSTNFDQPHFLTDKAERHIDTHFRLLRHDTFGEMKELLGGLMHAMEKDAANPKLHFGDFRANQYVNAFISYISFDSRRGLGMDISFTQPSAVHKKPALARRKWWEESKRLREGVLLSFMSFQQGEIQHLFFTVTEKNTDPSKDHSLTNIPQQSTINVKLASHDQSNVESAISLSCQKAHGLLVEFPGVIPATFTPILENLQDMQRLSRLPFRQWILPDRISDAREATKVYVPPPLYARKSGFSFSLNPLLKQGQPYDAVISINPASSANDPTIINEMEARTDLDRGQCRALLSALTQEFVFIQGPPGTGKSYLGIQLLRVLLHCKQTVDLGPVVVVCYTNHALDQFLEHLLAIGIKKIIRIGGQSRSNLLEDHNLRKVSQMEMKTRSERYLLAKHYKALDIQDKRIKGNLGRVHGLLKPENCQKLSQYLLQNYPRIQAQFLQFDSERYKTVGRHPLERWASTRKSFVDPESTGKGESIVADNDELIQKAEANIHSLSHDERRKLVAIWTREAHDQALDDLFESVKQVDSIQQQMMSIHDEVDRRVLQDADIIGITTTGLAKRISTLKHIRSKVVVCEEAGEVMEAHMLSAFLPTVEHFIQIGDHEQLRPQINNFLSLSIESKQGALYQLDRSQFERLSVGEPGRPSIPVAQLNVQRRMRPEISMLVRESIYPKLEDHPSTKGLPDVVGMRKNLFWLDHNHYEENQHSEMHHKSHSNLWEVDMAHALVRHIVRQGAYSSNEIAVLTPYTGQLQMLRAAMQNDFEIVLSDRDQDALEKDGFGVEATTGNDEDPENSSDHENHLRLEKKQLTELLRVATVDNFQGEEAKVIIVSLVRSNKEKKVGFLRTTNRINVLLSRAQHGMYLIGNVDTYSNIPMWQQVASMLRASDSIGNSLGLCCSRHKDTSIEISEPVDFAKLSPEAVPRLVPQYILVAIPVPEPAANAIQRQKMGKFRSVTRNAARSAGDHFRLAIISAGNRVTMEKTAGLVFLRVRYAVNIPSACCNVTKHALHVLNHVDGLASTKGSAHCPVQLLVTDCHVTSAVPKNFPAVISAQGFAAKNAQTNTAANVDARVDLLEMKQYAEVDVNETPIIVLGCGHFFTAETLDGLVGMHDVYTTDQSGRITGLANISGALASKIPHCPDCQRPVRQYATRRFNRLINRAVIDEVSKRFLVKGWKELGELELQVKSIEQDLVKSRSEFITSIKVHHATFHAQVSLSGDYAKKIQSRYETSRVLNKEIKAFLHKVSDRHQPAHKLHEATVHAINTRGSRPMPLDDAMESLSIVGTADCVPAVERDRRITLGGRITQIKAECIVLEDKFNIVNVAKSAAALLSNQPWNVAPNVAITGRDPEKIARPFLHNCSKFVESCNLESLPKLAVEGSLYYARIARLYQFSGPYDKDVDGKAAEYVSKARELLVKALELCNNPFRNSIQLRIAVEKSISLLQMEWYEPILPEELASIKQAMVTGPMGIVTHSGHWYNCSNGHPFAIGECGMPMEQARCPECGASIGGLNHQPASGVTRAMDMEE